MLAAVSNRGAQGANMSHSLTMWLHQFDSIRFLAADRHNGRRHSFPMTSPSTSNVVDPSSTVLDPYCEAVLFCWAINHHQADDTRDVSVYVENNRFAEIMIKDVKQGCRYKLLDTRKHRAKHFQF